MTSSDERWRLDGTQGNSSADSASDCPRTPVGRAALQSGYDRYQSPVSSSGFGGRTNCSTRVSAAPMAAKFARASVRLRV